MSYVERWVKLLGNSELGTGLSNHLTNTNKQVWWRKPHSMGKCVRIGTWSLSSRRIFLWFLEMNMPHKFSLYLLPNHKRVGRQILCHVNHSRESQGQQQSELKIPLLTSRNLNFLCTQQLSWSNINATFPIPLHRNCIFLVLAINNSAIIFFPQTTRIFQVNLWCILLLYCSGR